MFSHPDDGTVGSDDLAGSLCGRGKRRWSNGCTRLCVIPSASPERDATVQARVAVSLEGAGNARLESVRISLSGSSALAQSRTT